MQGSSGFARTLTGILPAAGLGTRMGPAGRDIPKCLLTAGKDRLLDRAIDQQMRLGVRKFIVVVGHLGDQVRAHLEGRTGFELTIVEQKQLAGLPAALAEVAALVRGDSIVYCPDNYLSDRHDLGQACREYERTRPDVLVCAERSIPRSLRPALVVEQESEPAGPGRSLRVTRLDPAPEPGREVWTSTGVSFQNHKTLSLCASGQIRPRSKEVRLLDVWQALLEQGGTVRACPLAGRRYDITTEDDLRALNAKIREGKTGVAVILRTAKGGYVLMQRDDKPGIRYPGWWALFGGGVEGNETPEQAARRELQEELGVTVPDMKPVYEYENNLKRECVFEAMTQADPSTFRLREGKCFKVFDKAGVAALDVRPDDLDALQHYWTSRHE